MKKPLIGIVPLSDCQHNSLYVIPRCMNAIVKAGGTPCILPKTDNDQLLMKAVELCDGFILTGGQDTSIELTDTASRGSNTFYTVNDDTATLILDKAIELDKPLLGICTGLQFMNAALGGSFYQEIVTDTDVPLGVSSHVVQIESGTPLADLLHMRKLSVSGCSQRQIKQLSPLFKMMARTKEGQIEAVYMPLKRFIWAVQWHPDLSYRGCEENLLIWKNFVDHCKELPL